jgi:hypothetical protein
MHIGPFIDKDVLTPTPTPTPTASRKVTDWAAKGDCMLELLR